MDSGIFGNLDAAIAKLPQEYTAYALKNKEIYEKFSPLFDDEETWKKTFESDDKTVQSYYGKTDEGKVMAKGVATFPFKPEKVQKYAMKLENRPLYDETFVEGKIIHKIEDKENNCEFSIIYVQRGGIKMVDPRDFVGFYSLAYVDGCAYGSSHSIVHPECPERKGIVRGDAEFYVQKIIPGEGGKGCVLTRMFRGDPKGSIPDFVKDIIIKNSGQALLDMRKSMLE